MTTYTPTGEHITVTTLPMDRWDLLAWRMYGDARLQSTIIAANRTLFLDDFTIPAILSNVTVRVPVLERDDGLSASGQSLLPPWKRDP